MAVITGKCKWASIINPNVKYEPCWTIDIIVSEEKKRKLEKAGYKVKEDKEGDLIFKVKRKVKSKKGKEFDPPIVQDEEGNEFKKLVGNGSEVKVKFTGYEWEALGSAGKSGWLDEVTIIKHVAYEEDDENFDTEGTVASVPKNKEHFDEDDIPF